MSRWMAISVGVAIVAGTALLWASHAHLLRAMWHWLDVGGRPKPAEYVLVLNGDEHTRPFVAVALLKAGLARRALVTEVSDRFADVDGLLPNYHEVNRRVLLNRGIADRDITILPASAATTYDEAKALAAFLKDQPAARVTIVTNDFHTRRSRYIFTRVLGKQAERISMVSAPMDDFNIDCWWQSEAGFVTIATEYLKFGAYVARYGYVGHWLVACGILLLAARFARRRESSLLYGWPTPFQRDGK